SLTHTPISYSPIPHLSILSVLIFIFFFNDTATTAIYTLSLHDALPIFADFHRRDRSGRSHDGRDGRSGPIAQIDRSDAGGARGIDRKSTRLNSSHLGISYAVFCLKKKKRQEMSNSC